MAALTPFSSSRRIHVAKALASDLVAAGPRTAAYAARAVVRPLRRTRRYPDIPPALPTMGLLARVLLEEIVASALPTILAPEQPGDLGAVRQEVDRTIAILDANGWLDDPRAFHQKPPPPERPRIERRVNRRQSYEVLSFESGYYPPDGAQHGEDRWDAVPNRTAHAHVLRHPDGPRRWLVVLHGYSVGGLWDFMGMGAGDFHEGLGLNVIAPVAPYHGARRVARRSGMGMVSFDYVRNLHAFAQAVWDIRRCVTWAEAQGATSVSVYGMSMGGYLAALVAGVDERLDRVIAGVPSTDIAAAMRRQAPRYERGKLDEHGLLGECLDLVHRPIAPLALPAVVPRDRRFVYGGIADRITTPGDAYRLWVHWEKPTVLWFRGTHMAGFSGEVRSFVAEALGAQAGAPRSEQRREELMWSLMRRLNLIEPILRRTGLLQPRASLRVRDRSVECPQDDAGALGVERCMVCDRLISLHVDQDGTGIVECRPRTAP